MRRLGIHSFVWTDGRTQAGLEKAMEQAGECGYRIIELAYLRPEQFDLDRLAKRAKAADLAIVVTMGLPVSADVCSEDPPVVRAGETLLSNAVKAVVTLAASGLAGSSIRRTANTRKCLPTGGESIASPR
jgi:D-psicose/D-tagatose/L-ribulose 3-epimerase